VSDADSVRGGRGLALLTLAGMFIAFSTLRQWDSTHLFYHAATIALFLGTIPFRRVPLVRTILAMAPILGFAEILLRNLFVAPSARTPLTPAWIGLAVLYFVSFALTGLYDRRFRQERRARA
jgi:hypothetical protein